MLDKNGILASLLKTMRQSAADQFCAMLREIADTIEAESEPLEEYGQEEEPEGFAEMWADR